MSAFTRIIVLLAAAVAATGTTNPAAAALFGDDVARKQIADQQRRVDLLYQQHEQLSERLARLEEAIKNQPVMTLASQIEAIREDMRQLRGQIEVVSHNIDMAAKRQRDMYVDLDSRLRRLEQASGSTAPPAAPPSPAPAPGASAAPPGASAAAPAQSASPALASGDEGRVYEAAQQQRRAGNYQAAITAFQAFLAQFPKSPLAPRAQYWIGDSYYNLRDFKSAIANQQKLISSYPESSSVPDALLNMASSQLELGDSAAARRTMDTLVSRYPASDAAEKAKRRLATLR
ncbi:MAG TPA: tol-pal system protein YbgF [Burkholderiales bacterium]|nr:tol-pal system protein YbgF [Burkholderiales bacterium]